MSVALSVCLSVCRAVRPSVCPSAWNKSAPTLGGRDFDISLCFENLSKIKIRQNMTRVTGTLHGDLRAFMEISR